MDLVYSHYSEVAFLFSYFLITLKMIYVGVCTISSLDTDQATCAYFWDLVKNNNKYYIDFLGSQISRRSFPSHPNLLYIHKSLSVKILCQIFHTIFIKSVFKFFRISYCLLSPSCLAGRGRRTPCSLGIRVFQ